MADISSPTSGMVIDVNSLKAGGNVYSYALNTTINGNSETGNTLSLQNEASNYLSVNFPANFKVIGTLPIYEQNRTLFFLVRPETGESQIGEISNCNFNDDTDDDNSLSTCSDCIYPEQTERTPLEKTSQTPYCTYRTIVSNLCFNFHIDFPVRSRYKITDCGLNIYFTDNRNQRRYIYFDYDSENNLVLNNKFKVITGYNDGNCKEPIYSDIVDCNKINYHPIHETFCIEVVDVISGGSLKAGTYQFIGAYSDKDGNPITNPLPATNPTPIFTKEITFDTNYNTDRAISINVTNLEDKVYDYFVVIVAQTVDSFTSFKEVGVFSTLQGSFIYTGNEENLKKLTPNDVFFRNPFYDTAGNITDSNDYLFFSELTEFPKANLQRVANKIKLHWQTIAIPEPVYKEEINTTYYRGYNRDEVYPMGIIFITENGEEVGPFHIPGPSKDMFTQMGINVDQIVSNNDVLDREECLPDVDCCQPIDSTSDNATVSFSCNDHNCTQQGDITATFTFPTPTREEIVLDIAARVQYVDYSNPTYVAVGTDLIGSPLPLNTTPWVYYDNGFGGTVTKPFRITIPAGVTNYVITPIFHLDDNGYGNRWICHNCQEPLRDVWFKVQTPNNLRLSFSNTQGIVINNILNQPIDNNNEDCIDCTQFNQDKRWQVYNTGFVIGTPYQNFVNCHKKSIWEWGQFSYWESLEKYPNNFEKWGELCGEPIRHHKFPDSLITHIHDGLNTTKGFNDNNIVFPIGILVDHQSVKNALNDAVTAGVITLKEKNRIREYRIIRGNRVGNESIVAKGLLFDMWNYDKDGVKYYYPNYPYNDLNPDNFISPTKNTYSGSTTSSPIPITFNKTSRYTFHSPNVHFTNKQIGTELKIETLEYGQSEGFFNKCEEQAEYRFLSTFAATLAFGAGLAAAFSAEKEKECKQITIKSERHILPFNVPIVGGSAPIPVPWAVQGDLAATPYVTSTMEYGEFSNIVDPLSTNPLASEVTYNTCKGTPLQLLSITSGNPAGILTGGVMQIPYLLIIGMREMQIIKDLMKALLPLKNFAIQYNSIGKYNNYQRITNTGNKIRAIQKSAYLEPMVQNVNEAVNVTANQYTTIPINNHHRERSVYLKLDNSKVLPNPSKVDNSRFTLDQAGLQQEELGKRVYRNVSSYYTSIKNYVPDQYGRISDIEYLETDSCTFSLGETYLLEDLTRFGGDTFINRLGMKRKMPFFLQTRFKVINEGDVQYSDLGNVGYPNYYFNTEEPFLERFSNFSFSLGNLGAFYQSLIGIAHTRLDAKKSKAFYQSGFIHLYNYGIPYFFAESDINVDYRHGENNLERDFFPHQGDLNFWLQEKNVPITEDNYYLYNKTYSKQNKESVIGTEPETNDYTKDCRIDHNSRIIVSDKGNNDSVVDEWLRFRGNEFFDFPAAKGKIISIDGIENDKVLVRFENSSQIFGAYSTLKTDSGDIKVGNAGLFQSPPKEFTTTKLGYAGSQNINMLQTEFGHVWIDAKRGQVFVLAPNASGLDEIAKDGMRNWFKENLPSQLLRDFPKLSLRDLDNTYKGIGITLSFDKRFSRIFITKLDYKKIDSTITYNPITKVFLKNNVIVELSDKRYFCNKSWTISYSFLTKSWVSFYSFTPNYYIDQIDYTQSGLNSTNSSLWSHNVSNKSHQVFYGKLYPYIIETISDPAIQNTVLHSVEFETEALRYHNLYDFSIAPYVTFNKAIIYNERQCSGLLDLTVREENDLYQSLQYPKVLNNERHILITNKEGKWRINDFYDTVNSATSNLPIFINDCSNANKQLNLKALNYFKPDISQPVIRAKQTKTRLINDKHSNNKIIFHFLNHKRSNSII